MKDNIREIKKLNIKFILMMHLILNICFSGAKTFAEEKCDSNPKSLSSDRQVRLFSIYRDSSFCIDHLSFVKNNTTNKWSFYSNGEIVNLVNTSNQRPTQKHFLKVVPAQINEGKDRVETLESGDVSYNYFTDLKFQFNKEGNLIDVKGCDFQAAATKIKNCKGHLVLDFNSVYNAKSNDYIVTSTTIYGAAGSSCEIKQALNKIQNEDELIVKIKADPICKTALKFPDPMAKQKIVSFKEVEMKSLSNAQIQMRDRGAKQEQVQPQTQSTEQVKEKVQVKKEIIVPPTKTLGQKLAEEAAAAASAAEAARKKSPPANDSLEAQNKKAYEEYIKSLKKFAPKTNPGADGTGGTNNK